MSIIFPPFFVRLFGVVLLFSRCGTRGSEFPERECCDSAPPPPPNYHTVTSTTLRTTTTRRPDQRGSFEYMQHTTLNCLEAKQLCHQDLSCSAILKGIPLLCGPELVACSTVTVARCQAALRTLASFTWFQPTCLCKEPALDPVCNAFRDLLLDHPCIYVYRKEVDMHPLRTIPTCEKATEICTNNSWCRQRLDDFSRTCTVTNDKCSNPDREGCLKAWLRVRETPLLGCICPNSSNQECSALQSLVNSNPCVGSSTFMRQAAAMTKTGVILGSSLVRPLPLYPEQPPILPPTSLLVLCNPTTPVSESSSEPKIGASTSTMQCDFKLEVEDVSQTDSEESLRQIKHVVGTCQSALQACRAHVGCRNKLAEVATKCRITYCHPKSCRDAVSQLYQFLMVKDPTLGLHIGLCICRRTGDRSDTECVNAQGYLHPECAERSDSRTISHCHRLGRECRGKKECRYRLEYYEQACAADTLTGRCAGQHQECRKAAMGLFGSPLHINCVCKGDDFKSPSKCLTWKRLMWGNPCVVESQLTYYLSQKGPDFDPGPDFNFPDTVRPRQNIYDTIFDELSSRSNPSLTLNPNPFPSNLEPDPVGVETGIYTDDILDYEDPTGPLDGRGTYPPDRGGLNEAFRREEKEDSVSQARKLEGSTAPNIVTPPSQIRGRAPHYGVIVPVSTMETSTWHIYVDAFTPTKPPTSPLPEKYCKVTREWDAHSPRIVESDRSIRLYKNGNKDCSEICRCTAEEETYCNVLECTENTPCETSYAVYNHNAPAYQALRGECICYSGDFICMRPKEDEYQLSAGLFLLLGFSHKEEALLATITNGRAVDALPPLQHLLKRISSKMDHECHFKLIHNTSDNMVLRIVSSSVTSMPQNSSLFTYDSNMKRLLRERDECKPAVEKVASMINSRHHEIHHHVRLSLFVLAEVLDTIPNALKSSGAPAIASMTTTLTLLPCICVFLATQHAFTLL